METIRQALITFVRNHNFEVRNNGLEMPFFHFTQTEITHFDDAVTMVFCIRPSFEQSKLSESLDGTGPDIYAPTDQKINEFFKTLLLLEPKFDGLCKISIDHLTDTNWLVIATLQY